MRLTKRVGSIENKKTRKLNEKTRSSLNNINTPGPICCTMKSPIVIQLVVALCLAVLGSAHNVLLPAHGRRCFFEELNKGDELAVSFQFGDRDPQSSHQLKGDFFIYDSQGNQIQMLKLKMSHSTFMVPFGWMSMIQIQIPSRVPLEDCPS